jgi:hypothetical protein
MGGRDVPQLQNLDVQFVSLVDKAAVRDPSNPTQAQRFLLWKAQDFDPDEQFEVQDDVSDVLAKVASVQAENEILAKRARKLEKQLRKAARAITDYSRVTPSRPAAMTAEPVAIDGRPDDVTLLAKADRLRKADPTLSRYQALLEARRVERSEPRSETPLAADTAARSRDLLLEADELQRGGMSRYQALAKAANYKGAASSDPLSEKAASLRKADPSLSEFEALRRAGRSA